MTTGHEKFELLSLWLGEHLELLRVGRSPPRARGLHSRRLRRRQQQRTRSPPCSAPRELSRPRVHTLAGASATAASARGPLRQLRPLIRARRRRRRVILLAGGRKVTKEPA